MTLFYPDFGTQYGFQTRFNPPRHWWVSLTEAGIPNVFIATLRQVPAAHRILNIQGDVFSNIVPLDCFEEIVLPPIAQVVAAWELRVSQEARTIQRTIYLPSEHKEKILWWSLEYSQMDGFALSMADWDYRTAEIAEALASVPQKYLHLCDPESSGELRQAVQLLGKKIRSISSSAPLRYGSRGQAFHPSSWYAFGEEWGAFSDKFPGILYWDMKVFQAWCDGIAVEVPVWL